MPIIPNEETMEVNNEKTTAITIQYLETNLNEIFEQIDFIKIKEKLAAFNNAKLAYKAIFLNKLSQYLENFKSDKLDKLLKDYFKEPILVTLNDKKVNSLIENIKSNRLELLQRGFKDLKKALIENPKELINLIQALQKKNSFKARIDFNKQLKNFPFLKNSLNAKEDNVQLLTHLNQQLNQLIEIIEQHEFINILNDMIQELESYKALQSKGQELLSKQLEQNKFIDTTLFVNNNADENINLLLELIDPKTHACIIDNIDAPKIVDILVSILAEKDVKKTEACFPLLYNLIESKLLNAEHLKLLLNNLFITSDKCTWFINRILQQFVSEKQQVLDEGLKTCVEHLRLNNIKLLLNLGANPNQIEVIMKKFQEEFEDKKNKDQHKKQKYKELLTIVESQEPLELIKPKILTTSVEKNSLLITDIIAIMCADTKRAKQNHPINEELCQAIIEKYKTTINANIPEDYKTNLLRLMQRRDNLFDNELEKFIQLNTPDKTNDLNYLLSKAVCMTNIKAVRLLIQKKANPKIIDKEGNTLLHLAARNNQPKQIQASIIELIQILINEGVDKQAKNKEGYTLFSQAIQTNQQYLIDFLSFNSRSDAAKSIRVNLSNGRQRLITDQKMLESELRKIEKGKHSALNSVDMPELIRIWRLTTNFDQLMSKIQIENDESTLNDYLKNFNKEYNKTDLECLKSLYVDAVNFLKEKLRNLEMPMQASNEQDELASSLVGLTVAAKQPKLEGVTSMLFARVTQSNESSLKHKQCTETNQAKSDDQAMEVSLSFTS